MDFIQIIDSSKTIAETVTAFATAGIVITSLIKKIPILQRFFVRVIGKTKSFFYGTVTLDGKRVRFWKGLKEQRRRIKTISEAIAPYYQSEELLVLDKDALFDLISRSGAFHTIHLRKS
jgi:hypothetical protein